VSNRTEHHYLIRHGKQGIILALVWLITWTAGVSAQAGVIALKRDAGLDTSGPIDARFQTAAAVVTTVSDAPLGSSGNSRWYNYGAKTTSNGGSSTNYVLYKFDLSSVPDLAGARVRLAELRLYHISGNTGNELGQITTHDWAEGESNGGYPGATAGISTAHPAGRNTGPNQNANGGTAAPLQTWGTASDSFFNPLTDATAKRTAKAMGNAGADWAVFVVTDIVAAWAGGTAANYGFYQSGGNWVWNMSEVGSQYQPVLFIDYVPSAPPTAVTDLAASNADWDRVDLAWTAPADMLGETVASYDIRYLTSPIVGEAAWSAATSITGTPTPAAPGQGQTFTVTGLSETTTYYFATKSTDVIGLISGLSNMASITTSIRDVTSPTAVTDLAATEVRSTQLVLAWTASGNDGMTGTAASYDIRCSTSPIVEGNFPAATAVAQTLVPKAAGQAESLTVTGLTPETTYYFAMHVSDSHLNVSALSNVLEVTLQPLDLTPPAAITDLAATGSDTTSVDLEWTAPGDNGSTGTAASYEVRYSTSAIDSGNWSAATLVPNVPAPQPAGASEQLHVGGLQPMTTYYFAIRTTDQEHNVSALSNVAGRTTAQGQPITSVTIVEKAGLTTANYPLTLSLVFKKGDVGSSVTATIAAQALPTQTDVKVRYDDGSIKHALVSFLIPSLPAGGQVTAVFYAGGVNANGNPITKEQVLAGDFDAALTITLGGVPTTVSARQMLQDAANPDTWIKGSLCTEFLLKDFASNTADQLNVQYRVRVYQGWSGYRVDTVVENCWTEVRGNLTYDLSLALGQASPVTVLSKAGLTHNHSARWHKTAWGEAEPGNVQIKFDLPYMISTGLIPRYDLSLVVPESTLASAYSGWQASSHDLMQTGIVNPYFPTTGGRQEIGLYPTWTARYLLSMDNRQKEIMLNCADVSGYIPIHYREGDPARSFYGRIMSIDDRPTIWASWWNFSYTTAADRMPAPVGSTTTVWSVDMAHQASFAYVPYLVTGDFYYLEEMLFWAGYDLADGNAGYRQGSTGLIVEQVRGEAWAIRNVADAANLTPDGFVEKPYLSQKVNNNLAAWTNQYVASANYPAVHYWGASSNSGTDGGRPDGSLVDSCRYYSSPWMDDFVLLVMGHLKDIGFDSRPLINWLGTSIIDRFSHPDLNWFRGAPYHLPVQYNDGTGKGIPYATWKDINDAYLDQPGPSSFTSQEYPSSYAYIARAALTHTGHLARGQGAWQWLDSHLTSKAQMNQDPTWAVLAAPRIVGDVNSDGAVDVVDLLYLVDTFGTSYGGPLFNVDCDFNGDFSVDVVDLLYLVESFGQML
jgi:hypothetical protein